jgi:pimeloyl-ACP methyl ester carboxylesterase
MPDVVVLIPGITGSVLQKDGKDIWPPSIRDVLHALLSLGRNLNALKLSEDPHEVDDLGDGITATKLVPDVHLIPGLWKIDGYTAISRDIRSRFAVELGRNFFEFPYDWRRDNRVAARKLAQQSEVWLNNWIQHSGSRNAKLILIGHSMGGIVARHFLERLAGWKKTKKLITFGTPYRGSLKALNFLSNGYTLNLGPLELTDLTDLIRSFTSVYQLLPTYACVASTSDTLQVVGETKNLPGIDHGKSASALEFHRAIDEAAKRGLGRQNNYMIHPVVGRFQPTLQSAKLVDGRITVSTDFPGQDVDGDGTVPRPSATPRELSGAGREFYIDEAHASLQNNKVVLDQVNGVLTEPDWRPFLGAALRLSLNLRDGYQSGSPILIRAKHEPAEIRKTVVAEVVQVETRNKTVVRLERGNDGTHQTTISSLPPGVYRVTISAGGAESVSDIMLVA